MKKKVAVIGTNGLPARYGGFETFAEKIAFELTPKLDVSIVCSSKLYTPNERETNWKTIRRIFFNVNANGIQSIYYDLKGLLLAVKKSDYILLLGTGVGIFLPFIPRLRSKILIIHVDGLEWKRSKWNIITRLVLRAGHKISLRYAKFIIIDNEALSKYIPDSYRKKIIHVSYGGNHITQTRSQKHTDEFTYALVIARAEPENNLHLILKVFSKIQSLNLKMISNWNQTKYGKKLFKLFSNWPNIQLIPAIYDTEKLHHYRFGCSLYIHGHSVGGTNPSLVEAMYSGLPILAWDNEFNRITTHGLAIYFNTDDKLISQLKSLDPQTLEASAKKMQEYARQNYTWKISANKLLNGIIN